MHAGRNRLERLANEHRKAFLGTGDAELPDRAWPVQTDILADGLAKNGSITARIQKIVGNLVGLT